MTAGVADLTPLETGGDLYGLWTHGGRPVVQIVTGPGPNAVHEPAHFAQDIEFFRQTYATITGAFGLQWIGTWHSHASLGLDHPSAGDVRQVASVTAKNGFRRWCELIANRQCTKLAQILSRPTSFRGDDEAPFAISAFVYGNPQHGRSVRVPIRLLPGVSPFRVAALAGGHLDPTAIGMAGCGFPLARILFDAVGDRR